MADYVLQGNEAPILTEDGVQYGEGFRSVQSGDLILTNLHLIWVSKGAFNKVKGVEYFPLATVKVIDGRAQALQTKGRNGTPRLEIFFQDGERAFTFSTSAKIKEWMRAINRAVTGEELPPEATGRAAPGTAAAVAESLVEAFRNRGTRAARPARPARGARSVGSPRTGLRDALSNLSNGGATARQQPQQIPVSAPCSGCGSPQSGPSGTLVRCRFCESDTLLP